MLPSPPPLPPPPPPLPPHTIIATTTTTTTTFRGKYNIKRGIDGRVQLRRKGGAWMSVRLDMEVPGAILLRDMKTEAIYALETDGLPQVCVGCVCGC